MRVVEIGDASARTRAKLLMLSWALWAGGLVCLLVAAVGDSRQGDPLWGYGLQVVGTCCLWLGNLVGALGRWRTTFIYLGLHLAFALFLLANPVISLLGDIPFSSRVERQGAPVALWLLALSLVGLRIGAAVVAYWRRVTPVTARSTPRMPDGWGQRVLLSATLVTLALAFVSGAGSWLYVRSHSYAEYYTTDTSVLPAALDILGAASFSMVACYLAQFPRNRTYALVLAGNLVSTLPSLAMGLRSPFMGALVLAAAYTILRWRQLGGVRARVPVVVLVVAALAVPVGMAGLGALNYARFDKSSTSGLDPVTDFVYAQSVSYTVVSRGVSLYSRLPDHANRHFSFGDLTDYVLYGKPAQVLVGAEPLGGNTVRHATEGHEFSHAFSYYLYGQAYLDGQGAGSSYVIETYVDGGPALVLSYSLLLGALVMFLGVGFTRSWLRAALILAILPDLFLVARANATGFLLPLLLPHFWLAVGFTAAVRWVSTRRWRGGPFTPAHAPSSSGRPERSRVTEEPAAEPLHPGARRGQPSDAGRR